MPELPEVETIRSDLKNRIVGKRILSVTVRKPKIVKNSIASFGNKLTGNLFSAIKRRGKLLIFEMKTGFYLLVHLKMTGQLVYREGGRITAGGHSQSAMDLELPNKYSHVIFSFAGGSELFFNDLRQFGYLKIVDSSGLKDALEKFGPEPFDPGFTEDYLKRIFSRRQSSIKANLLNQNLVAGLGNIYVDEVLFAAGVRPERPVNSLKLTELKRIVKESKRILRRAIKNRGTTFNDYVDADGKKGNFSDKLKVYGRGGEKCPECGHSLEKIKLAGRGTVFCRKCQK